MPTDVVIARGTMNELQGAIAGEFRQSEHFPDPLWHHSRRLDHHFRLSSGFTRRYLGIYAQPPLSTFATFVLPGHPDHAQVGGTPPKHGPNGVLVAHADAC
jgi:hypothetical protein